MQSIGKRNLLLPDQRIEPYFILDNGLNPDIARVMSKLGYRIKCIQDEFNIGPQDSLEDPPIIEHIARWYGARGVWITKDTSAKRAHIELIKRRRISVIWIQQQILSTLQQHHIITHGIFRVAQDLLESDSPIHYLVKFHGLPNRERVSYKVEWKGR